MEEGKTGNRQTCSRTIGVRQMGADWETLQKREQVEGGPTSEGCLEQEFLHGDNGLKRPFQA